jgi:leader peptidase (prepilin peptidase) / N-methyltransferase
MTFGMLMQNGIFIFGICATLGLLIGSFLNVVIYRLPIMVKANWISECADLLHLPHLAPKSQTFNLLIPRSHCPHCKKIITALSNVPLISFLWQKGKCKDCGAKISWVYPAVELLTALATIFVVLQHGITPQTMLLLLLTWALIVAIFIDFQHCIIPDSISLGLLWVGLLINTNFIFTTPEDAIVGAACAYAFLWIIAYLFKVIRKTEGMGHGDFKLFAAFGAWFGVKLLLPTILLASVMGAAVGLTLIALKKLKFKQPMPFGPYIAFAGWLMFFYGWQILNWYSHFLHIK